jgi:hypothetical protein
VLPEIIGSLVKQRKQVCAVLCVCVYIVLGVIALCAGESGHADGAQGWQHTARRAGACECCNRVCVRACDARVRHDATARRTTFASSRSN